jgi:cobalt-zinc-cadmium efflux system outer membrane protein
MRVPSPLSRASVCAPAFAFLLLALAGCGFRSYAPKPVDPERTLAEIAARSLDAPGLKDYLRERGVTVDPWPRADWTLAELTWVALYHSPDLDIARSQLALARAGEVSAAQRPNPAIQLGGLHHSDTTPPKDSPWTVSLIVDLPIVTGGKREARIAHAQALSEGAMLDLAAAAWQVRVRVQARYLDFFAATEEGRLAEMELALRQEEAALLERRVARGYASANDALVAQTRAAEARLLEARAAARSEEARAALAQALGVPLDTMRSLKLSFADLSAPPPIAGPADLRAAALQNRLDIRRALADYAASEASLRLEIARQYPDLVLRPGYIWDQSDRIWALGSILLLPIANRNEGPILEAEARRSLEADRFLALQARTLGTLDTRQGALAAARVELAAADALGRDAANRATRTERRFEAGDADRLERTRVRLDVLSTRRGVLASQVRGLQAYALLEDAVQAPLDGSVAPAVDPSVSRLVRGMR